MKRKLFRTARAVALVAGAGLVSAGGCLNPRPEELPSSLEVDGDGAGSGFGSGGSAGSPLPPAPGDMGLTPSPNGPSPSIDEEDGGPELDAGLPDAESAEDAGAPSE
jgi:hypothetical protein